VVDVVSQGILGRGGAIAQMVTVDGMGWSGLLKQIVELAARRCQVEWMQGLGAPAALPILPGTQSDPDTRLRERQA
jgi:hypothetical protein